MPFTGKVEGQQQGSKFLKSQNPIRDRYIVVLKDTATRAAASVAGEISGQHGGVIDHVWEDGLRGFSIILLEAAAIAISRDPRVAYVEEDGYISLSSTQASPPWGLDRIDQRNLPTNGAYVYNNTGAGVNVYVIDTGIRTTHQEFSGRAFVAYDAMRDGQNGNDCNGHGTHVAGIIAGNTYGVAKGARVYGVRVFDCNASTSTSNVIDGINWVTANHVNPAAANMSFSGGADMGLSSAVQSCINSSVTCVVAAGNGDVNGVGTDANNFSPANVIPAITVAATDGSDRRASFSNYGWIVDVFAPGVNIPSAWYSSDTSVQSLSGTSQATPHVTGVAALYLQSNPTAQPATVRRAITYNASSGNVLDPGQGTANRLLYTGFNMGSVYPEPDTVPLYRFSTQSPLRHFYTTNYNEGASIGYSYEGIQCYVYPGAVAGTTSITPLYRFHTLNPLRHFYTTSYSEGVNAGYTYDGPQCYIHYLNLSDTVPLYRFRASNPLRHFYTTNYNEGVQAGFTYEQVQGYVYRWW